MMILEAKRNSETKVGKELIKIKQRMDAMGEKIKGITERVNRLEPSATGGLLKVELQKSIMKLEELWEGEVGALKHELWQTIQAHNHNADLLKHHKDAIDQIQDQISDTAPNPEAEQVHVQLLQVDKIMQKEIAKEKLMGQLVQRLNVVQQQLGAGLASHWGASGNPPAGVPYPGLPPAAQAAAKEAATKRMQQRKNPSKSAKASAKQQPAGNAAVPANQQLGGPTLRAEAPEFVPTVAGWNEK